MKGENRIWSLDFEWLQFRSPAVFHNHQNVAVKLNLKVNKSFKLIKFLFEYQI